VVVTFHSHPVVPSWRGTSWQAAVRQRAAHVPWRAKVAREFNRAGATAIAPSRVLRRTLVDSGLHRDRVVHIPQGSPAFRDVSAADRAAAKEELGYRPDDRVVLLFGFVTPHKGHLVALDALESLPSRYHLAFVGGSHPRSSDTYLDEVLSVLHDRPRLAERVRPTGYVPDEVVRRYFAATDVCIVPYTEHGLATSAAAVWALTSARPVVGTKIPALTELREESDCLHLVTPGAPRELAAAIVQVDTDEQLAKVLVSNAAAHCARTAWPRVAQQHLELYERALAERAAQP
jgi:glycosyltransferase involved in cell wall biosynthesis